MRPDAVQNSTDTVVGSNYYAVQLFHAEVVDMTRMSRLVRSHNMRVALAGTWIMTAGLVGVLGNVTSLAAGSLVLACGLVPPLLVLRQRRLRSRAIKSTILASATPS